MVVKEAKPTEKDWVKFWREVENIGVWNWSDLYESGILENWIKDYSGES